MLVKVEDARYWKNCVDAIESLIDEGTFNVSKEGIALKAMDPSGISMVSFFIPNKAFSKFEIEKPVGLGLNIDNMGKILSSARSNEQLEMKETDSRLQIEFMGTNSRRRYKLPLIDARKDADKEPKVQFEAVVELKCDAFREILRDANLLSSYIGFRADKNSFVVAAKGDAGELEEEYAGNADMIKRVEITKPSSATFNLDYLQRIMLACPSNSTVQLSLKTDEPLRLDYKIGEAAFAYFLAPYMES